MRDSQASRRRGTRRPQRQRETYAGSRPSSLDRLQDENPVLEAEVVERNRLVPPLITGLLSRGVVLVRRVGPQLEDADPGLVDLGPQVEQPELSVRQEGCGARRGRRPGGRNDTSAGRCRRPRWRGVAELEPPPSRPRPRCPRILLRLPAPRRRPRRSWCFAYAWGGDTSQKPSFSTGSARSTSLPCRRCIATEATRRTTYPSP